MRKRPTAAPTSERIPRQPFIQALLRMTYEIARKHQLKTLESHGLGNLTPALLNVMVYPHPDGVRAGDLAERLNLTKQATNYFLGELEALGYIERRAQKGSKRRLVFLTRRGWQSIDLQRAAVLELEAQWAKAIGQKRFDDLKEMLAQLIALDMNRPDEHR
jgi:DNA-binding MarR family transcriptional regulator